MAMSPRLLRPRASVHPEAANWATRVIDNGGTFSSSTLAAVSTFCRSIDREPGLRAAILRCNLFCGNPDGSLNAVRTPLYLSGSFGGATIGNTTDTNNNFVEANYQETGSGGGLKGDGSTRYLNTGLTPASLASLLSIHLSVSGTSMETSGDRVALGAWNGGITPGSDIYALDIYAGYVSGRAARLSNFVSAQFPVVSSPGTSEAHFIANRTSAISAVIYRSGTSAASNSTSVSPSSHTRGFFVFALNSSGNLGGVTAARLRMYSIGNGLNDAQALAFSNAVIAFNTALGRA
jgi:hypothetical protein